MGEDNFSGNTQRMAFESSSDAGLRDSGTEKKSYAQLQESFAKDYDTLFPDLRAHKTIVVIPSLTLDQEILARVNGFLHYEERLLCMLILLRMPRSHLVYVSSLPIDPIIIDYYLHLLPGISPYHAGRRLTLLGCYDYATKSLTSKILSRPRLLERIRSAIPPESFAHIACFNVTEEERRLAVALQLPIFGADPDLLYWGTKSGSRKLFRDCGIPIPAGIEDLRHETDIIQSLVSLKKQFPATRKAVVKLNDGFSREGNAIFSYTDCPDASLLTDWLVTNLPKKLHIIAKDLSYDSFIQKFAALGGIVETFIEGKIKTSPSVQCRITPSGNVEIISTHDQLLSGEDNQVFQGASFPANSEYAADIAFLARRAAEKMALLGVLGRFSIDFMSVQEKNGWKHFALETNLRKGGTTHPYLMLQFLTDGHYDENAGVYFTASNQPRYYFSSDNLQSEQFVGLSPHDLMEIVGLHGLLYDGSRQEGVMFHLIGALSQYGKLGILCIGRSHEKAAILYQQTVAVLLQETQGK